MLLCVSGGPGCIKLRMPSSAVLYLLALLQLLNAFTFSCIQPCKLPRDWRALLPLCHLIVLRH